jgi:hypothetical protein
MSVIQNICDIIAVYYIYLLPRCHANRGYIPTGARNYSVPYSVQIGPRIRPIFYSVVTWDILTGCKTDVA